MIVATLAQYDERAGTALYVARQFPLGASGQACAIPCAGYTHASVMVVPVAGEWTTGAVRACVSNAPDPIAWVPHWLGYQFTLVGTRPAVTDAIPLAHRWLVLEVTAAQAGVVVDVYVHLTRGGVP